MVGPGERLRAGVIGLRRGLSYVRLLQVIDDVELVAVADLDAARLEALRTDSPPPIDVYDAVMFSLPGLVAKEAAASGQVLPIPQLQRRQRKVNAR